MRCKCNLEAKVGHARNHGRPYASCAAWPNGGCGYFRWLEPATAPPTPDRWAPSPPAAAAHVHLAPLTPSPPQQHRTQTRAAAEHSSALQRTTTGSQAAHACVRAFLIVRAAPSGTAGRQERVSLALLPALDLPPAACAALYEPAGERRLPHAPAAAASLQPPYVRLQPWAPAPAVLERVRRCIPGGSGASSEASSRPLFVLDTETTGLSSERDHVHQLSVLNLASGQLLSLRLRACPGTMHPAASQACGVSNDEVHSPQRPTFLQVAPLLSAFMSVGAASVAGRDRGGSDGGSSGSGSTCSLGAFPAAGGTAAVSAPEPPIVVAAHNARFDARLVAAEFGRRELPLPAHWRWLDTLPLARSALPDRKGGHSLGALQTHYGLQLPPGQALHDATTDVCLLAQLLPRLLEGSGLGGGSIGTGGGGGGDRTLVRGRASSSSGGGGGSGGSGGSSSASGGSGHWLQDFAQMTARKTAPTAAAKCAAGAAAAAAAAAAASSGAAVPAEDGPGLGAEARRFTCPWCLQRVIA